jgi:hypothetical protein
MSPAGCLESGRHACLLCRRAVWDLEEKPGIRHVLRILTNQPTTEGSAP